MDTSGFSQVGRYGTLSLLKKRTSTLPVNGSPEQSQVVTSFGIDNASLTFGRASSCDVRLYYPSVDPVHCTVVNEDGKAFLAVQGKSGALVDGCWVYPHTSSSSSKDGGSGEQQPQQSIIPLSNNTVFEVHGKRFKFTHPPKEVRRVLLATPATQRNRKLRLSMIQSAQVFSPRPSHDPRENLRILQSPIRTSIFGGGGGGNTNGSRSRSQSPTKARAVSPLKFGIRAPSDDEDEDDMEEEEEHDENQNTRGRTGYGDDGQQAEEEDHIVLVHTNYPRVVEEERDLVILEDVPLHLVLPSPSVYSSDSPVRPGHQRPTIMQPKPQQPQAYSQQVQPPSTPPRRRSIGSNALHRAVLIRSAQRAVWKAEKEREELEEELEVLDTVVDPIEADEKNEEEEEEHVLRGRGLGTQHQEVEHGEESEDVEMRSVSDEEEYDEEASSEEDEDEGARKAHQKPLWRKSIEKIIPWPFGGGKEDNNGHDDEDENSEDAEDENDAPAPLPVRFNATPARRPLGSFMTPQLQQHQPKKENFASSNAAASAAAPAAAAAGPGRYSLGGGEARRVIIQQPWKINDLVVPPIARTSTSTAFPAPAMRSSDPPEPLNAASVASSATTTAVPGSATKAPPVTEEERRAIQERRRSAARELKTREDVFWKDGAPGMMSSPAKSPAKVATGLGVGRPSFMNAAIGVTPGKKPLFGSPTKGRSLEYSIQESEAERKAAEEDEGDKLFLDEAARSSKAKATATPRKSSASKYQDDDDDSLDTNGLLERMRETVESMKRRRSSAVHRVTATPKGLFGEEEKSSSSNDPSDPTHTFTPARTPLGNVKKIDFTRINTPAAGAGAPSGVVDAGRTIPGTPVPVTPPQAAAVPYSSAAIADVVGTDEDESASEPKELEPFSLLRPGAARPSLALRRKEQELATEKESNSEPAPIPVVVVDTAAAEEDEDGNQPEPEVKARGARGRPRMLRAPKAKAKAKEIVSPADEEAQESEELQTKAKSSSAKPTSRIKPTSTSSTKPRSRSAARSPAPEHVPAAELAAPQSGPKRRQRSKTPQPRGSPEEAPQAEPEPAPTRSAGARKTRKDTAEPEEPAAVEPVKRKGRKATAATEPEAEVEVVEKKPALVKRGREPRSTVVAPAEDQPSATPAPAKRGRSKKAKDSVPTVTEENEDSDELDSYPVALNTVPPTTTGAVSSSSKKKTDKEKTQSQIRPPSRTQQRKAIGSATKIKQEPDADENTDREQKAATTTRGRAVALKTPAPRTAKAAAGTGTGAKPRGRPPKTPASGPAATPGAPSSVDDSEEKENAPRGSGNGSDESKDEPVTKIRVSRRTAGTSAMAGSGKSVKSVATTRAKGGSKAAAVKVEEDDDGPVAAAATTGRARTTRVMRTRTKTG